MPFFTPKATIPPVPSTKTAIHPICVPASFVSEEKSAPKSFVEASSPVSERRRYSSVQPATTM